MIRKETAKKIPAVAIAILFIAALLPSILTFRGERACSADDAVARALDYLRSRQQEDGGFAEPERSSSEELTSWVICAISSAGGDVRTWAKSGGSPLDFVASRAAGLDKLTGIERVCIAVSSAGGDPRSFAGRDLVAEISSSIGGDGRIGDMINEHCWGVIALASAREPIPDSCRSWLASKQNIDGGFSFAEGQESDPDDTGAALQALVAAGESPESQVIANALAYLKFRQGTDGGFVWRTSNSNSASTAWAVQGIAAAGADPASEEWTAGGNSPIDYLRSMQQADGHVRYASESDPNPVWTTAEAIPAFLKTPYPVNRESSNGNTSSPGNESRASSSAATDSSGVQVDPGEPPADPGHEEGPAANGFLAGEISPEAELDGTERGYPPESGVTGRFSAENDLLARSGADTRSESLMGEENPGGGVLLFAIVACAYLLILLLVPLGVKLMRG